VNRSGWVSGLRFFAWVVFIAMIIASIVLGVTGDSFVVFLGGVILSFLLVAWIMVFLDNAENLAAIREGVYELVTSKAVVKPGLGKTKKQNVSEDGNAEESYPTSYSEPYSGEICYHCGADVAKGQKVCGECRKEL